MNNRTQFLIPKETGTYADTLKAVGLATLLDELAPDNTEVTVGDAGANFVIRLSTPLPDKPNGARLTVGYQYFAHEKAKPAPTGIKPEPFLYKDQRALEKIWQKWNKAHQRVRKRNSRARAEEIVAAKPRQPDNRLSLFKAMRGLFPTSDSWNNVAHAVQRQVATDPNELAAYVTARMYCQDSAMPRNRAAAFEKAASVLQTFWPTAGKGINRPKPDGAKIGQMNDPWVDWFNEWCRYRGVGYLLTARPTGTSRKDLKFLCLLPGTEITLPGLRRLTNEVSEERIFFEGHAYTNVKSDVFAVLGLAKWLIIHSEYAPHPRERIVRFLRTIRPGRIGVRDLLAGMQVAYFKSLGTGRALSNVSTILLPDWLPVSAATYEAWRTLLDEHQTVLATLGEYKGEEAALLIAYRDALSRNQLDLYLDFFADYGAHYMRRKGRKQYSEQFTQQNVEVLIMALSEDVNPRIADLIKSAGFRSLANAVHEATVKAQYWKGQGQQDYDIHYGLAQKWKRAVDQGTEFFLHELADFVRAYNEENGKRQEKKKPTRDAVTQTDLDTILNTITSGELNARMVCLLLLAYGYSMTANEKANAEARREANRAKRKATI